MPQGVKSKELCFKLWLKGKKVKEISIRTTAKLESIRHWVREWERGRQMKWDVS